MIKKTKLPGLVTVMCSATLLLAACGKQSAPETHDSINIGESAALSTADNSQAMDNTSSDVMEQVGEGLYDFTAKGTLKEALATNMPKATNGGKTYTFNLRRDAKWSNGDPVTAQDFVYSWRRTVDPKTKSPQAYYFDGVKNYSEITARKKSPNTLGIQAVGKYKLVVTLDHAMPYFPSVLAVNASFPLNQKYVEKEGKKYGTDSSHTLYNGAYTLTNWNGSSDSWTYSKNKYYWNKKRSRLKP
nr:peptide ABC transporter substrate-binding protein [Lacticaseibacillus paracasei]